MSTVLELEPAVAITPPPRRHWRRTLTWLIVSLVIFVCGGVTGHGVTVWMWEKRVQPIPVPAQRSEFAAKVLEKMKVDLGLNDDQTARIDVILQKHHAEIEQIRIEVGLRFGKARDSMMADVSAVLDDAQREKWLARMEELKRVFAEGPRSPRSGEHRKDGDKRSGEDRRPPPPWEGGDRKRDSDRRSGGEHRPAGEQRQPQEPAAKPTLPQPQ
jgi:hypothetical protein